MDYKGSVLVRLDQAQVEEALAELEDDGVEAVAVSLIWSVANDGHERAVAGIVAHNTRRCSSASPPRR